MFLDSVIAQFDKSIIDWILSTIGRNVQVIASRMTEDGYELILEGEETQVKEVVFVLSQGGVL